MPPLLRDFALEVHFSKWEFKARYHLTASDLESVSLSELLDLADDAERAAFESLHLGYTETYGDPALRQEIAKTYDEIGDDQVLCFAGAEEGIYTAMRVLLEPGDHAVVLTPNYQAAESLPLQLCEVSGVALEDGRDWTLNLETLEAALQPNTKLISVNFPNNPTGKILPRAIYDRLIEICRARGIWLFNDEVYRLIERDESLRLPQAADAYERGISLNVMSKAYGLPGLRIGWLACQDRGVLQRCERYKHYLSICNSGPSEVLARIALKNRNKILARNRALVRENAALLDDFFANYPALFDWRQPDGSCVGFVRYKGSEGVEAFTERLIEEAGILLLPSSIYRSELNPVPEDYFRIGFGRKNLPEALAAFRSWLQRNQP